jgi:hypothetical protein
MAFVEQPSGKLSLSTNARIEVLFGAVIAPMRSVARNSSTAFRPQHVATARHDPLRHVEAAGSSGAVRVCRPYRRRYRRTTKLQSK